LVQPASPLGPRPKKLVEPPEGLIQGFISDELPAENVPAGEPEVLDVTAKTPDRPVNEKMELSVTPATPSLVSAVEPVAANRPLPCEPPSEVSPGISIKVEPAAIVGTVNVSAGLVPLTLNDPPVIAVPLVFTNAKSSPSLATPGFAVSAASTAAFPVFWHA